MRGGGGLGTGMEAIYSRGEDGGWELWAAAQALDSGESEAPD